MTRLKKVLRFRIKRNEDGFVTVEFVILFPVIMFFFLSVVEYSLVTLQQSSLEQATDRTVRDIRLGTGLVITHDGIKDAICARSVFIRNCSETLRLEMIVQDAFSGLRIPPEPDCTENSEEANPVREFQQGRANELMVLRACAKVEPVFPTTNMARALSDDDGTIKLTATTAFVQEPG